MILCSVNITCFLVIMHNIIIRKVNSILKILRQFLVISIYNFKTIKLIYLLIYHEGIRTKIFKNTSITFHQYNLRILFITIQIQRSSTNQVTKKLLYTKPPEVIPLIGTYFDFVVTGQGISEKRFIQKSVNCSINLNKKRGLETLPSPANYTRKRNNKS